MKKAAIPLSRLSFEQKLDLMETLWADLSRDEKKLESPDWHKAALMERSEAYATGKVATSDWEQAKKRIKKKVANRVIDDTVISLPSSTAAAILVGQENG